MKFDDIIIEDKVKEKILSKHGVTAEEVQNSLLEGKPFVLKTKDGRYLAITHWQRYITVILEMGNAITAVVTAYPSSDAQKRLYKKKNE